MAKKEKKMTEQNIRKNERVQLGNKRYMENRAKFWAKYPLLLCKNQF